MAAEWACKRQRLNNAYLNAFERVDRRRNDDKFHGHGILGVHGRNFASTGSSLDDESRLLLV